MCQVATRSSAAAAVVGDGGVDGVAAL